MSVHGSITGAWLNGLLLRVVCFWVEESNYKLNDHHNLEWVMASVLIISIQRRL